VRIGPFEPGDRHALEFDLLALVEHGK
jgi:hypothetical protein